MKIRLAPMCPWIGTLGLGFVGPPNSECALAGRSQACALPAPSLPHCTSPSCARAIGESRAVPCKSRRWALRCQAGHSRAANAWRAPGCTSHLGASAFPLPACPPAVKVQLAPYNRIRLMKIPILQASQCCALSTPPAASLVSPPMPTHRCGRRTLGRQQHPLPRSALQTAYACRAPGRRPRRPS